MHQILSAFLRWKADTDGSAEPADPTLARVLQLLEEHVVEGITIAALAEQVHMNPSYLCTLFKKTYGMTITERMNILQRDRACRLLAMSELSVGEIAYQTGNRTASSFAQWFRKEAGMTPGEYRRLVRGRKQ